MNTNQRPTIKDIARESGVSVAAVSFALNGKAGISSETRQRILATTERLGWTPNTIAKALSKSQADAIGLFINRRPDSYAAERFFFNFILGVQHSLTKRGYDLVLHNGTTLDEEITTYRKWVASRRVDGVILVDPRIDDHRGEILTSLGLPGVFVGRRIDNHSAVITSEKVVIETLARHLADCGSRSIAYVSGITSTASSTQRATLLKRFGERHNISVVIATNTNPTERAGYTTTLDLLSSAPQPDAIIFDNEVLALGGLNAAHHAGVHLGSDVKICSCEDSPICHVANPSITAMKRDPACLGSDSAKLLLRALQSSKPLYASSGDPTLVIRESTVPHSQEN